MKSVLERKFYFFNQGNLNYNSTLASSLGVTLTKNLMCYKPHKLQGFKDDQYVILHFQTIIY